MKILYLSALCSNRLLPLLSMCGKRDPGYAVQKFSRLIVQGLIKNGADITALSSIPASYRIIPKRLWFEKSEIEDGVKYKYIPFVNMCGLRQLCVGLYAFFYILFWGIRKPERKAIVCDVLNVSLCLGALLASKFCGLKSIGVMTDMPGLMVTQHKSIKISMLARINRGYMTSFDGYVFLTEAMAAVINRKQRPYIVMEGLVPIQGGESEELRAKSAESEKRIVLYAGGLHEKYGIKTLIEGFTALKQLDVELHLYGAGPMVPAIRTYEQRDPRIVYKGLTSNKEIVEKEKAAALLVNPRPSQEDFTRFSFPSKNMEYMVSGTPVLTTRLPGMPEEYNGYVYLVDEETVDGFTAKLNEILALDNDTLTAKGVAARSFVSEKKNNIVQAARIYNLIEKVKK